MPAAFTYKKLTDVSDSAPKFGYEDRQEARFATRELEAQRTGVSMHRVAAGRRQGFGHRHDEAEEVYVVLSGSGRVKLDDAIVELEPLDAIRVAPQVTRCFEGGPDGIQYLAFGALCEGDGEIVPDWWKD